MNLNRRDFLKITGAGAAMVAAGPGIVKNSAFAMNPRYQATSDISFVGSSAAGTRRQMIKDVLEPWRATVTAGITGKTILIKPNVVSNTGALVATHVDALRGLIDFLRTITSAPIIIGECSASAGVLSSYTAYGYNALATEYTGVTLMDLNNTSSMPSVDRHVWNTDFSTNTAIPISTAFVDPVYYVISICRPKTHNCMVITGVNKNILMAAPLTASKQQMHGQIGWFSGTHANEDKCLAYNLFQLGNVIYTAGMPALAVLDAWEGMEGNGPANGTSIMQYCAVAGVDPLAVDRLCAKLMGFSDTPVDPMNKATPSFTDARALVWLSNAGFGNYDLSKINFILGSLSILQTFVKTYALPINYTGSPSYETNWTGGPPTTVFDIDPVKNSYYLDPKPFLAPQIHKEIKARMVKIDFSLPIGFSIHLGIYTPHGEEIKRLGYEYLSAGRYSVMWNCRNGQGALVPAGRYVIKLGFGTRSICDHLSILK